MFLFVAFSLHWYFCVACFILFIIFSKLRFRFPGNENFREKMQSFLFLYFSNFIAKFRIFSRKWSKRKMQSYRCFYKSKVYFTGFYKSKVYFTGFYKYKVYFTGFLTYYFSLPSPLSTFRLSRFPFPLSLSLFFSQTQWKLIFFWNSLLRELRAQH